MQVHPISPVFDRDSKVLILGSFPSVKSREAGFFYGHPQNRFWKVTAAVFGEDVPQTIEEKRAFLLRNHIAVWDVIHSCEIEGSSDASIRNVVPNDLSMILDAAAIDTIYVNGKTALKYYERYLQPTVHRHAICLPSTSPANAAWTIERLVAEWRCIKERKMELWDAYDSDFKIIPGVTLVRGEEATFAEGVYHLVCEIILKHVDGTYLIMQRDPRKAYGSMWEATAGGSALRGENPLAGAIRELREETGIVADRMTEVGRVVNPPTHSVYAEYFAETSCDKDSVILQEGETVAYRWIDRETLLSMKGELLTHRMWQFVPELKD